MTREAGKSLGLNFIAEIVPFPICLACPFLYPISFCNSILTLGKNFYREWEILLQTQLPEPSESLKVELWVKDDLGREKGEEKKINVLQT